MHKSILLNRIRLYKFYNRGFLETMKYRLLLFFIASFVLICSDCAFAGKSETMRDVRLKLYALEDEYLSLPEERISVAEGALLIEKVYDPRLDVNKYLGKIDFIAEDIYRKLKYYRRTKDSEVIDYICAYFDSRGMKIKSGKNFLSHLLDKNEGSSISFSLLLLAVAEKLNIPVCAVKTPSHVFVRFLINGKPVNIETMAKFKPRSDRYYIKKYGINAVKNSVFMKNLTKKELLFNLISGRGVLFSKKSEYEFAQKDVKKAVSFIPLDPWPYNDWGCVYKDQKKYKSAIECFNKAISLYPRIYISYYNLAQIYVIEQDLHKALAYAEKAVAIEPDYNLSYYLRARIYKKLGEEMKANADLDKIDKSKLSLGDTSESLFEAVCDAESGKIDRAVANLKSLAKDNPDDFNVLFNMGKAYLMSKDYVQAEENFTKAIKINSRHADVYLQRAKAIIAQKDYDRALVDFNKALELDPGNPNAYWGKGSVYNLKKDYEKALDNLNKALSINPDNEDVKKNASIHIFLRKTTRHCRKSTG